MLESTDGVRPDFRSRHCCACRRSGGGIERVPATAPSLTGGAPGIPAAVAHRPSRSQRHKAVVILVASAIVVLLSIGSGKRPTNLDATVAATNPRLPTARYTTSTDTTVPATAASLTDRRPACQPAWCAECPRSRHKRAARQPPTTTARWTTKQPRAGRVDDFNMASRRDSRPRRVRIRRRCTVRMSLRSEVRRAWADCLREAFPTV